MMKKKPIAEPGEKPYRGKPTPSPEQWQAILERRRAILTTHSGNLFCPECWPVMLDGCASHAPGCPYLWQGWQTRNLGETRVSRPAAQLTLWEFDAREQDALGRANQPPREAKGASQR